MDGIGVYFFIIYQEEVSSEENRQRFYIFGIQFFGQTNLLVIKDNTFVTILQSNVYSWDQSSFYYQFMFYVFIKNI